MSITAKRMMDRSPSYDLQGNLRIGFRLSVEDNLSPKDAKAAFYAVADFLDNFEGARADIIVGDIIAPYLKDSEKPNNELDSIEYIDVIEVRVGVAQEFQEEFNAEFSTPEA